MATPAAREVRVRVVVLTFQVACEACAATAWIDPRDCEALAWFGATHRLPTIDQAELLVDDVHRIVPAVIERPSRR